MNDNYKHLNSLKPLGTTLECADSEYCGKCTEGKVKNLKQYALPWIIYFLFQYPFLNPL